jgi:hypothetical protein
MRRTYYLHPDEPNEVYVVDRDHNRNEAALRARGWQRITREWAVQVLGGQKYFENAITRCERGRIYTTGNQNHCRGPYFPGGLA